MEKFKEVILGICILGVIGYVIGIHDQMTGRLAAIGQGLFWPWAVAMYFYSPRG